VMTDRTGGIIPGKRKIIVEMKRGEDVVLEMTYDEVVGKIKASKAGRR